MTSTAPTLVALAAGSSTRFGRLKQLEPLGPAGETLLEYSALYASRAGFGRLVMVVSPETGPAIRDALESALSRHLPLEWCVQRMEDIPTGTDRLVGRRKPWGTAHAVLAARHRVDGAFGVVNADDWYGPDALGVLGTSLGTAPKAAPQTGAPTVAGAGARTPPRTQPPGPAARWHLVTYPLEATLSVSGGVSRAVCAIHEDGLLERIEEVHDVRREPDDRITGAGHRGRRELSGACPVSMNLWGLDTRFFGLAEPALHGFVTGAAPEDELALPDVVQSAVRDGGATVLTHAKGTRWIGVTHPGDRDAAARALARLGPGPRAS